QILRQPVAAESNPGLQKCRADARIKTNGVGHFLNVATETLAEIGKYVRVGNLDTKKSVRNVLNEFRAVDASYEKLWRLARRTWVAMHRAGEAILKQWVVDFAESLL